MRKIIFPVVIILIVGFAVAWFFLNRQTKSYSENSAFKAIPAKTPLIVEVPDVSKFLGKLAGDDPAVAEIKSAPELQSFWRDIAGLSSLLAGHEQLREALEKKPVLIAFNPEGKSNIGCLFAFSLENRSERSKIIDFFKSIDMNRALGERQYDDVTIYSCKSGDSVYHFAEDKGIFLLSRYSLFVEDAVRQVNAENLLDQEQFKALYNTVSEGSDFNIFINQGKIFQYLAKLTSPSFKSMVQLFTHFADWTELDVKLNKSEFLLGGFSFSDKGHNNYLNIFRNQEAGRFNIDEVLSANLSMFLRLNLSDFNIFQNDYGDYLKRKQGSFYRRESQLSDLNGYAGKPFIPLFGNIAGSEFALVFGPVTPNEPRTNRFFIAGVKGQSSAKDLFLSILRNYAKSKKTTLENMTISYQIQNDRTYDIYEFPFGNFPELLLGKTFSAVESNYLCFYDNYLIFSDNVAALKNYIRDLVLSGTLKKDSHFQAFNQQMSSRSSFYAFLNFSKAFYLKDYYLNRDMANAIQENEEGIRKFYALGWQFSSNSGEFLNNLYLKYDPAMKEEPQTVWQTKLDSTLAIRPQLVINHKDPKNLEILVQDKKNNLYLINKEGVSLWKVKLSGPVMGNVYQIDYYRNGKLQYFLNTRDRLYLIDRNGNPVARFPLNLKSPATVGVSVFDYDRNRDYRYFVACEDRKVYAYDREGKPVKGWTFDKADGTVTNPVRHFRIGNKDYLVFEDQHKTYIMDRQGAIRVRTGPFDHSGNDLYLTSGSAPALATTDTGGNVHLQYFDGSTREISLGAFGEGHYFMADDLNGGSGTDFIIANEKKLYVFSEQGKKIFEKELGFPVSEKPVIYGSGKENKKIGIVCRDENRIYLFRNNGQLYPGFPLQGSTEFSIGYLSSGDPYFNLIAGNEDNSLYNYKME